VKLKSALLVFTPPVLAVGTVALINPSILTWPVVFGLAIVMGIFGGAAMMLFE
jgi:hypothetical protein